METTKNYQTQEAAAVMLAALTAITSGARQSVSNESDKAEVYNMTSGLFPCVSVAMYGTLLSPEKYEKTLNDKEDQYYYFTIDFQDWKKELTKAADRYIQEYIIDSLRNYGCLGIKALGIWSPKYYNYYNDELDMEITMQRDWRDIMAKNITLWRDRQDVKKYISDHWRSCSGYVNLMPESLDEILSEEDENRQLAAYLTLALLVEGALKPSEEVIESLYDSMSDFSDYTHTNVIEEYMGDYDGYNLLDLWGDDVEWNDLYWTLAEKIGFPWLHENTKQLFGKQDRLYCFNAKSEGERCLFWAVQHGYTVQDLYDMAA